MPQKRSDRSTSLMVKLAGVVLFHLPSKQRVTTRAARVLQLTVPEQGIIKYHASSCYRSFQRDMAKTVSITQPVEQSEPLQQTQGPINDTSEQRCKDLSPVKLQMSVLFVEQIAKLLNQKRYTHGTESVNNQWPKTTEYSYVVQEPCVH